MTNSRTMAIGSALTTIQRRDKVAVMRLLSGEHITGLVHSVRGEVAQIKQGVFPLPGAENLDFKLFDQEPTIVVLEYVTVLYERDKEVKKE